MLRIRERADQNWLRAETEILNNSAAEPTEVPPQKKQPGAFKRKAKKTVSVGQAASL